MLSTTLILLACSIVGTVTAAFHGRTLGAAAYKSSLNTRSQPYELSNEAEFVYAEHSNAVGSTTYGAKVKVISDTPILVLEQMEDWLSTIKCSSGSIYLSKHGFIGSEGFDDMHKLIGGHVITSHPGCNAEHERLPYRVIAVEETPNSGVLLSVLPATWEGSFRNMKVQLGYTTKSHELRAHSEIRRRLQKRQSNSTNVVNTIPTLPAPDPNNLPDTDITSGSVNLTAALTNKPIDLPGDLPIQLTCLDCRTFGFIDYSFGDFDIDFDDDLEGFHVTGAATVTAQGFGALVNVSADIKESYTFLTPLLSAIAMDSSIHIPGLGKAGLTIGPFIVGGYDLNGSLAITSYGFDMRVPDGSQVVLNISDFSSSAITGFENTTVTPLPLDADVEIDSLDAWIALRSTIAAKFEFEASLLGFDASGQGGAGVYVDTPIIIVNATRKTGVGADCQPMEKGLENALSVDYTTSWNFGAYINGSVSFGDHTRSWSPDPYYSNGDPVSLPPQCRGYVDNQYVNASVALQKSAGSNMAPQLRRAVVLGALGIVAVTMVWL